MCSGREISQCRESDTSYAYRCLQAFSQLQFVSVKGSLSFSSSFEQIKMLLLKSPIITAIDIMLVRNVIAMDSIRFLLCNSRTMTNPAWDCTISLWSMRILPLHLSRVEQSCGNSQRRCGNMLKFPIGVVDSNDFAAKKLKVSRTICWATRTTSINEYTGFVIQ